MPNSKKRQHHPHHHTHHPAQEKHEEQKSNNTVKAGIIFFVIIGLGISYFAAGANIIWLSVGVVLGGLAGYYFGKQMEKAFSK